MQLAQTVSPEQLKDYVGGEIILANDNGGPQLVRGIAKAIRIDDTWAQVMMTCAFHAPGTLDDMATVKWQRSSGNVAPVTLMPTVTINDQNQLVFSDRSPQGSIAVIGRRYAPKITQLSP